MKLRSAELNKKDFKAFNRLYHEIDYSNEVGRKSLEKPNLNDPMDPAYTYEEYSNILERGFPEYFMFEINGKIVGSVSLEMDENEISEFIIEPKFQQKGYGKKMYKLTEKLMRDREKDEIYLTCFFPGAMAFWRKMGFINNGILFIKRIKSL
jgi:hypothetical protein